MEVCLETSNEYGIGVNDAALNGNITVFGNFLNPHTLTVKQHLIAVETLL